MMTVFFKVNTISVEGAEKYSAEEITTALDINKGDNLYLWNKMKVRAAPDATSCPTSKPSASADICRTRSC